MGALTVLDDCGVTVKAYVRDFSGHLFVRNLQVSLLVVFSWPRVELERVTARSLIMQAHAGSQVARWMWNSEKSQARRVGGQGREDHRLHSSGAKHYTLAPVVHWSTLRLKQPSCVIQPGDPAPLSASECVFWSLITQWSPRRFHIMWAQGGEYLWCRNAVKTWCEVSDSAVVQLCGWQAHDAEAGVKTRPPTVRAERTHCGTFPSPSVINSAGVAAHMESAPSHVNVSRFSLFLSSFFADCAFYNHLKRQCVVYFIN